MGVRWNRVAAWVTLATAVRVNRTVDPVTEGTAAWSKTLRKLQNPSAPRTSVATGVVITSAEAPTAAPNMMSTCAMVKSPASSRVYRVPPTHRMAPVVLVNVGGVVGVWVEVGVSSCGGGAAHSWGAPVLGARSFSWLFEGPGGPIHPGAPWSESPWWGALSGSGGSEIGRAHVWTPV